MPRLVCLAYVRGFYFLFCCVEVSSLVLCLLYCVGLCCKSCCVALRCVAIRCVVSVLLRCVAIRCVAVVLYLLSCIALCCDPLCCVVDKFSISSIPSMLKLYISRHTQPTSLTGRQSLHQRTRQTQPPLPNRKTQHLSLTL